MNSHLTRYFQNGAMCCYSGSLMRFDLNISCNNGSNFHFYFINSYGLVLFLNIAIKF